MCIVAYVCVWSDFIFFLGYIIHHTHTYIHTYVTVQLMYEHNPIPSSMKRVRQHAATVRWLSLETYITFDAPNSTFCRRARGWWWFVCCLFYVSLSKVVNNCSGNNLFLFYCSYCIPFDVLFRLFLCIWIVIIQTMYIAEEVGGLKFLNNTYLHK